MKITYSYTLPDSTEPRSQVFHGAVPPRIGDKQILHDGARNTSMTFRIKDVCWTSIKPLDDEIVTVEVFLGSPIGERE